VPVSSGGVSDRDLDVVVFGAGGVTGRRVAAYLAERAAETGLRWAPAVRDAEKAERILAEAGVTPSETIVADVSDASSLAAMAARARVVLNLVGPYTRHGRPVIDACVANGAHYADLTGEIPFVRRMIDEFDDAAAAAGVKIVQVCGFEALPPDLSVLLAAEAALERFSEGLAAADLEVTVTSPRGLPRPSDGISGGTFQSIAALMGEQDAARTIDPAALITDPAAAEAVRRVSPIALAPRHGSDGAVIAPMAPAPFINPAVIQRTAALIAAAGRPPEPFRYREGVALAGGPASLALRWGVAGALSLTQTGLRGLAGARPAVRQHLASALQRVGPSSGFGPAADRLEGWGWGMSLTARTVGGHEIKVRVEAEGHPGYLATARMLGEAGMLLAEDGATPERGGCLTPATALGAAHVDRFERARVRFSVDP
jgi:short subunit dehydrogenase-like uncharacterized protein